MYSITQSAINLFDEYSTARKTAVVIDGGYFETGARYQQDRYEHLIDSLKLHSEITARGGKCILTAFVNDFCAPSYCGYCGNHEGTASYHGSDLWSRVPKEARDIYRQYLPGTPESEVTLFGIRATRNRVASKLSKLLKQQAHSPLVLQRGDGDVIDLFVTSEEGDIFIGSKKLSSFALSVRCTALMAQHYHDLFRKSLLGSRRNIRQVLIYDFNRAIERDRVSKGADVGFALYQWPQGIEVTIANYIYYPNNDTKLNITKSPTI